MTEDLHPLGDGSFEAALKARIEAQLADVQPDFEDMMRRAERRDEGDFEGLDPNEESPVPSPEQDASNRRVLRPYVSAYRGRLDEALAEIAAPAPTSRRNGGRAAWWMGLVAAAALVIGWLGAQSGLGRQSGVQVDRGSNAVDEARREIKLEEASTTSPTPRPRREATAPEPEPEVDVDVEVEPEPETEPVPVKRKPSKPSKAPSVDERIAALDAAAQAAWRTGDKRTAKRKFETIVAIGGRRPAVELAFGELFSLNRQLGESPSKAWKAYLKRFPRGRYAEDAKAGLCRRAKGEHAKSCWAEYADSFPGGTHLEEASQGADP